MTGHHILLSIRGVNTPLAFDPGLDGMVYRLREIMHGWPMDVEVGPPPRDTPRITLSGQKIMIRWKDGEAPFREPSDTSAIASLIVGIVDRYVAANPKLGILHAAAVEIEGGLALFPAGNRVGKSTLAAAFSAAGFRVFADDLLPVDFATREGVSTGCLTRLRLPLPASSDAALARFVSASTISSDGHYGYVRPSGTGLVRHGERRMIAAIVLLDRCAAHTPARIDSVASDEALLALLSRDTRLGFRSAGESLAAYERLVATTPCLRLTYAEPCDAVRVLAEVMRRPSRIETTALLPSDELLPVSVSAASQGNGMALHKAEGLTLRRVGVSGFIADERDNDIHVLNAVGTAVWTLIDGSIEEEHIVATLAEIFPETPVETIRADVGALIAELCGKGLLRLQQSEPDCHVSSEA
jgi:hypothetical protein